MSKRLGIIDLGSNTVRMVVFQYQPHHSFKLIDEVKETVRLAHGIGDDNLLQQQPMSAAVETLTLFAALGRATGVDQLIAVATSAVRDAANQPSFLGYVKERCGLELRVLSGEEEAYYGYLGVANSLSLRDGFIIDIGGGSVEVSLMRGRGFVRASSLPLGTVRLMERFLSGDPPSKDRVKELERHLAGQLADLDWFRAAGSMQLVAIGGTARGLARLGQAMQGALLDKAHGYQLSYEQLDELATRLARMSLKEREAVPGMNRERADVMLPGILLMRALMRHAGFSQLTVGGQGLREGLFYEQFLPGNTPPLLSNVRAFGVENLARLYHYQQVYAEKVRELSLQLFDQLQLLHGYGAWERELLASSALLHDIGVSVSYYDHHKHSAYLVLNSTLPGHTHRELLLLALLTRYQRKGSVDISLYKELLARDDEQRIARLSALLRLARQLERGRSQVVQSVECTLAPGKVSVAVLAIGDVSVEIWEANRSTSLFRKAYDSDLEVTQAL